MSTDFRSLTEIEKYDEWESAWQEEFDEVVFDEPVEIATGFDSSPANQLRNLEEEVSL